MRRKIIKQANKAYTITLPIKWIRKNNLNEKSEIEVIEQEKSLIISSQQEISSEKIKLDVKEMSNREIYTHINSLYAKGVDEIQIIYERDVSQKIMRAINYNIGYALVSQEKNKLTIRDIGGIKNPNIDEIFKRVFQLILAFYRAALDDIFGKQKQTMKNLIYRDLEVNKFCLYLQRAINKMTYPNIIKGRILFTYSFALEKISDEVHRLWRTNINKKIKKTRKLKEVAELSYEGLARSFDLYYQFDNKKIKQISDLRDKTREKASELKPDTTKIIKHFIKIVEDASDLNHLNLMINLKTHE
jgi:phosphate uptake regulator